MRVRSTVSSPTSCARLRPISFAFPPFSPFFSAKLAKTLWVPMSIKVVCAGYPLQSARPVQVFRSPAVTGWLGPLFSHSAEILEFGGGGIPELEACRAMTCCDAGSIAPGDPRGGRLAGRGGVPGRKGASRSQPASQPWVQGRAWPREKRVFSCGPMEFLGVFPLESWFGSGGGAVVSAVQGLSESGQRSSQAGCAKRRTEGSCRPRSLTRLAGSMPDSAKI